MDHLLIYNDLKAFLVNLGELLSQGGAHAWEIAVRQAFIEGFVDLIVGIGIILFFTVFALLMALFVRRYAKKPSRDSWGDLKDTEGVVLQGVILFATVLIVSSLISGLRTPIKQVSNPEFYAMKWLIQQMPQ